MFNLKNFLKREVKPALGCTEPGAVALAVARACEELSDRNDIASVRVIVSGSIYKNGMAVGIPGTRGARGNAIAAALGAICGKAAQQAFAPRFGDYGGESADAWLVLAFRPQGLFDAVDSARALDFGATSRAIFDAVEAQA